MDIIIPAEIDKEVYVTAMTFVQDLQVLTLLQISFKGAHLLKGDIRAFDATVNMKKNSSNR